MCRLMFYRVISKGTSAIMEFKVDHPICIETFNASRNLGRITLRKEGETITAGIVTQVFSFFLL